MSTKNLILAIESSCDETSVAVVQNGCKILSNIIATQIDSHKRFGGVVPELASRHHVEAIIPCIDEALKKSKVSYEDLDAVAVTYGPGLVGSLLIGISAAKSLAYAHNLPLIAVNHMIGHIYSARFVSEFKYPIMALLISGGHTELVYLKKENQFEKIGETRDDAVGEAYDKIGRIMGISYPAGKEVDELALKGIDNLNFPRAMINENNYDFSFSGLKSSFINTFHKLQKNNEINYKNLAASFQSSVIDVLTSKTIRAVNEYNVKQLIVAGGVSANKGLREAFSEKLFNTNVELIIPPLRLCGDNAAMIGAAAYIKYKNKDFSDLYLNADPNLDLV